MWQAVKSHFSGKSAVNRRLVCGLTGIWHHDQCDVDGAALRRMTRALMHRGPDGEGYLEEPGIALGHRRLSIIDIRTGQQPLCNEDGAIWLVCNGEIFNHIELRADLERRGHRFRTQSDSETILHLYEERGLEFVDSLNGQFALALWDRSRRRLVLARDRVGIRPLFHATLRDGTLIFASEIKALFAHGALKAEVDPAAVGQIATLWVNVPPRTPFKSVEELGPGRMLLFEGTRRIERVYWQYRFPREHEYEEREFDYWRERVREGLDDAVRLQLRADVPVGAYLSGGLDSSIVTALAKRRGQAGLKTFSVTFADAAYDEREYQRLAIAHLGTEHREARVGNEDIGRDFAATVWFAERPMIRTAPAPLLRLSQLVRTADIKVVLTGEGADELFGGYNIFREDKIRRFWAHQPQSQCRPGLLSRLYPYVHRSERGRAFWQLFFRGDLENLADPYYSHRIRWRNSAQIRHVFTPQFRARMQGEEELLAELERYLDPERKAWHPLCRAQYLEMTLFMSGYLLNSQGDRMTMAHSVEGRVPFLDHNVIELAARIPPKFKLRALDEKFILKRAFADCLPGTVVNRPKQPYRAPVARCFTRSRACLAARLLQPEALAEAGIVQPGAMDRIMDRAGRGEVLSERDDMTVALVASLQLLHHLFVADFRPVGRFGSGCDDE